MNNISKEKHKKISRIATGNKNISVIITSLVIGAVLFLLDLFLSRYGLYRRIEKSLEYVLNDKLIDLYVSQLSLTFITITVTSNLSDGSNIIYWVNLVEKKLIEPKWMCFHSLTVYSFVTILYSTLSVIMNRTLGVFMFFILNIIVLSVLTFSMMGVYYNRDVKKNNLKDIFMDLFEEKSKKEKKISDEQKKLNEQYKACISSEGNSDSKKADKLKKKIEKKVARRKIEKEKNNYVRDLNKKKYEEIREGLREYSMKAFNDSDFDRLRENMELIADYYYLFTEDEFQYLKDMITTNTVGLFNNFCTKMLLNMAARYRESKENGHKLTGDMEWYSANFRYFNRENMAICEGSYADFLYDLFFSNEYFDVICQSGINNCSKGLICLKNIVKVKCRDIDNLDFESIRNRRNIFVHGMDDELREDTSYKEKGYAMFMQPFVDYCRNNDTTRIDRAKMLAFFEWKELLSKLQGWG